MNLLKHVDLENEDECKSFTINKHPQMIDLTKYINLNREPVTLYFKCKFSSEKKIGITGMPSLVKVDCAITLRPSASNTTDNPGYESIVK